MSTANLVSVASAPVTVSFELFPPRSAAARSSAAETLQHLGAAGPDFFSVTYGASGANRNGSREVLRRILATTDVTPMAHLTCLGATRAQLAPIITELLADGVRDFLALRGDAPAQHPLQQPGRPPDVTMRRSSELVGLIRNLATDRLPAEPVSIAVAAYPAGTDDDRRRDAAALAEKQAAGADFAITQVFYDAADYAALRDETRAVGVDLPLVAGLIPMTDLNRLSRLTDLTGVPVPTWLIERLSAATSEGYERGLLTTTELVDDVCDLGAPGLHVYTFNRYRAALDLLAHLRSSHRVAQPAVV